VERLTLLLVGWSLEGGGAERQMADMANYWAASGFSVIVATWRVGTIDFYPLDSRVRRVHLKVDAARYALFPKLSSILRRILRLRALLRTVRPDATLSFITQSNVLTILASVGLNVHIVVSERIQPEKDWTVPLSWRVLRRMLYARADVVVAQTHDAAQWIRRECRKPTTVIPNALRLLPEATGARQPLIVAVGRLSTQKGFDLLLRAFARIASEFKEWRVAIIGEGSERANLVRLRDDLGLIERVEFVGQVENVERWMACAGLVVQPSRFEGFPNVVLESMGMGAAVVCADCSAGPAELIEDGVNGRLVPVEDVRALATVMAELLSRPEMRERLGREALKVRQRFRQDAIMAQWEACLLTTSPAAGESAQSRSAGLK
jgi:GalNAc-alpha-(1->4)-GalNAc-alpha-(1->3)-diNAcBac-PP-undecaprenol alpha-1,4-N-acetyl-D-galactosaminyltransferase